ncbi:TPA: hypothetical protein ACHYT2_001021 [Enterobacter hormaechei]|jgi:hypothetical protein|uniref:hypothetical protein n=1 Tax=Cronobacter dublinensis TaxID=413497 RepID=UPI000CFAD257|nr:hypothetical protein [Cronobacter dublinensis]ELH8606407.1 hypothetical protein [Enterobacter asburiae]ELH8610957.1 hypothetical protein [Enterobacter asburiae]
MMPFAFSPYGEKDFAKTCWLFCEGQDEGSWIPDIFHRTSDVLLTIVSESLSLQLRSNVS